MNGPACVKSPCAKSIRPSLIWVMYATQRRPIWPGVGCIILPSFCPLMTTSLSRFLRRRSNS
ncbi:UNVERIFIED_CONTAM: hypothetical protein GTU68_018915 [Idotea baltica]|nr:hypothetical protein [Idotea baltica]